MRARLRRRGSSVRLTVKRRSEVVDGVTSRVELDGPASGSLLPARWQPSVARETLVRTLAARPLAVIATLRQRRLTRVFRRGRTRVEISLDALGALRDGRVVARRHELEAELLEGDRDALVDLAAALRTIDGVGAPLGSKLQFALDARAARVPERAPAGPSER
jgi:inorganic triphosphatase YgiF